MISQFLISLQANIFPVLILAVILFFALLIVFYTQKTHLVIIALLVWYPLESFLFNFISLDYFLFFKYFPEFLLYLTVFISWILYVYKNKKIFPKNPLNKYFLFFIAIGLLSWILNQYSFWIFALGLRQLLRFSFVFWLIILEDYNERIVKNILFWVGGVMGFEAVLGLVQYLSAGALDRYLFFENAFGVARHYLGELPQFWAPGTRVFATLGRYDQLGSFLILGLILLLSVFYAYSREQNNTARFKKFHLLIAGLLGVITLVLTYSRASWLAFLTAVFVLGFILQKDKKIIKVFLGLVVAGALYLGFFILTYDNSILRITDKPRASLAERVLEITSPESLKRGYEGFGRIFFLINTPLKVVPTSPLWGVGLGNYGGGVVASLNNTEVYDRLHLPFGIQNFYGQIDNNWFAIWGEVGTLGLVVWGLIFFQIGKVAWEVAQKDDFAGKILGSTVLGITTGICILGFFGPYFEFRSLMFYFWLLTGLMFLYWRKHKNKSNFLKI